MRTAVCIEKLQPANRKCNLQLYHLTVGQKSHHIATLTCPPQLVGQALRIAFCIEKPHPLTVKLQKQQALYLTSEDSALILPIGNPPGQWAVAMLHFAGLLPGALPHGHELETAFILRV